MAPFITGVYTDAIAALELQLGQGPNGISQAQYDEAVQKIADIKKQQLAEWARRGTGFGFLASVIIDRGFGTTRTSSNGPASTGSGSGSTPPGTTTPLVPGKKIDPISTTCSFRGDMIVAVRGGYIEIRDLRVGEEVWSQDERTGRVLLQPVLAQYSNTYAETVYISIADEETGAVQEIVSNRIHPFFVVRDEIPAPGNSSEGHVYSGPVANGHWVDAADLKPGDRLMQADGGWSRISGVRTVNDPLKAYNITVDRTHTYYIGGTSPDAEPIWVHNCNPEILKQIDYNRPAKDVIADLNANTINRPAGGEWAESRNGGEGGGNTGDWQKHEEAVTGVPENMPSLSKILLHKSPSNLTACETVC